MRFESTPSAARRAFTLVELLVVIGIVVLLAAIVLPTLNMAYSNSIRTKMQMDMMAIDMALQAYKEDFKDIPRVLNDREGPYVLCRALIGPQKATGAAGTFDGADGPGFRTRVTPAGVQPGKVYGPYLDIQHFEVQGADTNQPVILDRYQQPILYFTGFKNANVMATPGGAKLVVDEPVGPPLPPPRPMYNFRESAIPAAKFGGTASGDWNDLEVFRTLLGADKNGNAINPAYIGDYLVWSAGPDEIFGPRKKNLDTYPMSAKNPCDDVANFTRGKY